jgi:hypothetical protein
MQFKKCHVKDNAAIFISYSVYIDQCFETINYLKSETAKVLFCVGPPMIEHMKTKDFKVCKYRPTYERRLSLYPSNQSRIFSNYETALLNQDNSNDEIIFED